MAFLLMILNSTLFAQTTRYVKAGASGNGLSWSTPSGDLQAMINASASGDQIWVAGGTYKPIYRADNMDGSNPNHVFNAFVLKKDVKIYGGFAGTENSLAARNLSLTANASILSGNLGDPALNTDNAYHVVISAGDAGTGELNGFTIKDGNASGADGSAIQVHGIFIYFAYGGGMVNYSSSPVINNVTISGNMAGVYGGGMFNFTSSSPVIKNTIISGNSSMYGGGIDNQSSSSPALTNVTISGNQVTQYGGGIDNQVSSSPILINVTISGNSSNYKGGAMSFTNSSSAILVNSLLSGNTAGNSGGEAVYIDGGYVQFFNCTIIGTSQKAVFNGNGPTILKNSIVWGTNQSTGFSAAYSLVQGNASIADGNIDATGIAATDLFVDSVNGNYRLKISSPAIDKGNNAYFDAGANPDLSSITTDLDNNARIRNIIDLGAYENETAPMPVELLNFTAQSENNQAKLKWTTASETNNKEFIVSRSADKKAFTEIGKVAGAGSSSISKDYTFYDTNPENGINYYRLEQMDIDGKITIQGIRTVRFSLSADVIKLYPNPTKNKLKIEFAAGKYQSLELVGNNGQVLQRIQLSIIEKQKIINLSNQALGIYFVRLIGANTVVTKVVKE
jgi:hypothetical protein